MYGAALARTLESEVDAVDSSMALTIYFNCKNITETASERQAHHFSEGFQSLMFYFSLYFNTLKDVVHLWPTFYKVKN